MTLSFDRRAAGRRAAERSCDDGSRSRGDGQRRRHPRAHAGRWPGRARARAPRRGRQPRLAALDGDRSPSTTRCTRPRTRASARSDAADWMEGIDDLARFHLWYLDVLDLARAPRRALDRRLDGGGDGDHEPARHRSPRAGGAGRPRAGARARSSTSSTTRPRSSSGRWSTHPPPCRSGRSCSVSQPTPAEVEIATRNREMSARLTWKPYMFNPRLPHFLPRVTMRR